MKMLLISTIIVAYILFTLTRHYEIESHPCFNYIHHTQDMFLLALTWYRSRVIESYRATHALQPRIFDAGSASFIFAAQQVYGFAHLVDYPRKTTFNRASFMSLRASRKLSEHG